MGVPQQRMVYRGKSHLEMDDEQGKGKSHLEMDDEQGYPYDLGNLQIAAQL